jgi:hypothetical protein
MPKMTEEQLEKRKAEMTMRARAEIAKTEMVQFRIDAESISRLYERAAKYKMPIGTMVRGWVLDRLHSEEIAAQAGAPLSERDSLAKLHSRLDNIEALLLDKKPSQTKQSSPANEEPL